MKRLMTAALILLTAGAWAQNRITVDADYLSRGEIRRGGLPKTEEGGSNNNRAGFLIERTRLGFDYATKGLEARLTAQHSGTWGSATGGLFNVHEAWVKFTHRGLFAQVGRQNLSYDDQRIFGSDDWSMTGISHDALKIGLEGRGHKLHLFGAYNQNPENITGGSYYTGGLQPYKAMEALWYHWDIPRTNIGLSLLAMDLGMQGGEKGSSGDDYNPEKMFHQQLYGTFIRWKPKKWMAEAAYYKQGGKEENGLPLDAWMASGKLSFSPTKHFTAYGGYDYLSGDKYFAVPPGGMIGMVKHDVVRGFSSVYGSHHDFYGAMEFFYLSTFRSGFTPGLQNAYGGVSWNPGEKASLNLAYHFLAIATDLEDIEKPLGNEFEFSMSYKFRKDASLSMGYTFMNGTESLVKLKRSDEGSKLHWAWIMLTVSPRLFTSKN